MSEPTTRRIRRIKLNPTVFLGLVSGRIIMAPEAIPPDARLLRAVPCLGTEPAGMVLELEHPDFPELGPGEMGWFPALFTSVPGPTTWERFMAQKSESGG